MIKHHCPGWEGYWDGPCPSPDFVLPVGQTFTAEQTAVIVTVLLVAAFVLAALLVMVAVASMADG